MTYEKVFGTLYPFELISAGRLALRPDQKLYFADSCNCRMVPAAVTIPNMVGLR
jgi:hypothetical protein